MDQLTDFGKKVIITLVVIAVAALLFAGYKLIYLPLAAVESRYWNILINVLAICLATLMVGITGWVILRLAGNLKRNLAPHGEAVFQKTKEGKEFVGWRMPDGTFTPKPLPGFGSQATSISLHMGHQGYPPKYLLDTPVEEAEGEEAGPQALRPITFREVVSQIPPGKQLLGVRPDGSLRLGTLADDMMTTLYLGKSGSGKTVSVASELGTVVRDGALLMVADRHIHKPDSLARKIAPLAAALWPGTQVVSQMEDILALIFLGQEELDRRRDGGLYDTDLVIVLEEYAELFDDAEIKPALIRLSNDLVRAGRGFRVYGKFITQRMASGMAGQLRRLVQSYVIGRSDYNDANAILHDSTLSKRAMQLGPGSSIVVDTDGVPELLQRPYITVEDMMLLAQRMPRMAALPQGTDRERAQRAWNSLFVPAAAAVGKPQLPPLPMKAGDAATPAATTGVERPQAPITPIWTRSSSSSSSKRSKVTREQRKAICRMFQEETQSITAIARTVLGARGGEPFYLVKEVLAEEGLLVNEAAEAAEGEQN